MKYVDRNWENFHSINISFCVSWINVCTFPATASATPRLSQLRWKLLKLEWHSIIVDCSVVGIWVSNWHDLHSTAQLRSDAGWWTLVSSWPQPIVAGGWSDALCPCWHCQSYLVWMNEWFRRKNVSQSLIPLKDIHPEICGSFMFVFPWDKGKSVDLARTLCII